MHQAKTKSRNFAFLSCKTLLFFHSILLYQKYWKKSIVSDIDYKNRHRNRLYLIQIEPNLRGLYSSLPKVLPILYYELIITYNTEFVKKKY